MKTQIGHMKIVQFITTLLSVSICFEQMITLTWSFNIHSINLNRSINISKNKRMVIFKQNMVNCNHGHDSQLSTTTITTTTTTTTAPPTSSSTTRSDFIHQAWQKSCIIISLSSASILTSTQNANAVTSSSSSSSSSEGKQYNLSPEAIAQIVSNDLVQNSFLTNGKLTRSIYDERATFTDEIDTYTLPQWIKGTSQLFVGPPTIIGEGGKRRGSRVGLVGDVIATNEKVEFRFEEDLMFNIPFNPIVFVSGKVVLERDLESGLITSYREYWDQDVATVLKSARFK